ncbi:MAG TPA: hypothetical protein VOA87_17265 [Thermoanaerobaculia bacterium]|nr:hypothetical protein [Thermoanaerobaculia bacterium]
MKIRAALLSVGLSVGLTLAATACFGDWLVLRGGKKIETAGQWGVKGDLLTIREATGKLRSVLLSIVDFDATLQANPRPAKSAGAGWHISAVGIKMLQEAARQQEVMAAQMRSQQLMNAQMATADSKPGRTGVSPGGQAPAQGRPQPKGRSGFDSLAACKVWQDNPSAYSRCLAGN